MARCYGARLTLLDWSEHGSVESRPPPDERGSGGDDSARRARNVAVLLPDLASQHLDAHHVVSDEPSERALAEMVEWLAMSCAQRVSEPA